MVDEPSPDEEGRAPKALHGYAEPRAAGLPFGVLLFISVGVGGVAGSWLASFGTYLYHAVSRSDALRDGQYAFIFLYTAPVGWCAGVAAAFWFLRARRLDDELPGSQRALALLGALLLAPVVALPLGVFAALSISFLVTAFR